MSPARKEIINRRAVLIILALCFVAGHAGGLGFVPLLTLAGIIGLATGIYTDPKAWLISVLKKEWIIALALFTGWAWLSSLWSPYDHKGVGNALKLIVGLIFYEAGRRAFVRASEPSLVSPLNRPQKLMLYLPVIAALLICLDIISGFSLSFAIDPPGAGEDIERRRADAIMNTANGIVFLILMSAPSVIILLWTRFRGPIIGVVLLALIGLSAAVNGLNVGLAAVIFSICAMLAAGFYPKLTLNILRGIAMMLVGFAPIISAFAMTASPAFKASLPFSWEHRLVTWSYVGERIREHPIIGHGFDASRSFDATFDTRGFEGLAVVSLHPHNAGLQIWLETGVIGAVLAVTVIWCAGHEALVFARGGRARAMAAAGVIAPVILISSVSYGVWQEWWWAALFLSAGVLYLVPRTKMIPTAA